MTDAEAVAQAQLDIVLQVFVMLAGFLRRIDRDLPPSPQELSREDSQEDAPDITSEVRRVIQCVLADRLNGAIAELRAASIYKPVPKSGKSIWRPRKDHRKKKADRSHKRKA